MIFDASDIEKKIDRVIDYEYVDEVRKKELGVRRFQASHF